MINKQVIVRANEAGVFFGTLTKFENDICELKNARKIYYWSGACAVEQIAVDGVNNPDGCKFTVAVKSCIITNVLQIIPCTTKSIKSIKSVKEWKK